MRMLGLLVGLAFAPASLLAQTEAARDENAIRLISIEGTVEVAPSGTDRWAAGKTNQVLNPGDRVRTGKSSRALLRSSSLGQLRVRESSLLTIAAPKTETSRPVVDVTRGYFYFFNRDRAVEVDLRNRMASATTRGTEFHISITEEGRMEVTVLEGAVDLRNDQGEVAIESGEQGLALPGQRPGKTAVIQAMNLIQWCLYYPAVLDVDEAGLSAAEQSALSQSLEAYRTGDLVGALQAYPEDRQPGSDAERIYHAALLLAAGEVEAAEQNLNALPADSELAGALRLLIAAVQFREVPLDDRRTQRSTRLLAQSYYWQSRSELDLALQAARGAWERSPNFGFAAARVAELEFSFGRTEQALEALEKGLAMSPRNAQALALKGFLSSARNRIPEAIDWFEQAIATDGGLANGWLGRGLCRIKLGQSEAGRADLLVAAALEPQRGVLRSYLGKAFGDAGDEERAEHELDLARELDPGDPTSWFYSALLKQQGNRINEAIGDLEASQERNDNRSLFRSRLLLDQDRAVRGANLASIYRDAGMTEVSVREAARAVTYDYANYSAHLFLADSYNELRDPTRFNLRYETVWFNEFLLANLLAPVGGGRLSQQVSQQEYTSLFERDRVGLAGSVTVRSDLSERQLASQFGTMGGTSWALDLDYQRNSGVRTNNDLERIEWYTTIKRQVTPRDTAMLLVKYQDYHSGDNFQYYDPNIRQRSDFRFDEYQHPIAVGFWRHEWAPGMHTLLLVGRLVNDQRFHDTSAPQRIIDTGPFFPGIGTKRMDVAYRSELEIYTGELNQVLQWDRLTLVAGGRYQIGSFDTHARFDADAAAVAAGTYNSPAAEDTLTEDFERLAAYGYLTLAPWEQLRLTGGLAYDEAAYPRNFRHPPISPGADRRAQWGPKAALVWSPLPRATLRGIYAQSLGGVSLDESYRLEPTQLAGFPQAFRAVISESVADSVSAPSYETLGAALDVKLTSRTYLGFDARRLDSEIDRTIGYFLSAPVGPNTPEATGERLDYEERVFAVSLNQLLGDEFALGAEYRHTSARLRREFTEFPSSVALPFNQRSRLHQAAGYVLFHLPSGFFARAESRWYHQRNSGDDLSAGRGDDFFQHNLFAGWRFERRRAEFQLGILNLADEDYRLYPLTVYAELPRERVFTARFSFQF